MFCRWLFALLTFFRLPLWYYWTLLGNTCLIQNLKFQNEHQIKFIHLVICTYMYMYIKSLTSWPWSHGSWIYNYLCNQFLSPLMLWISVRARGTTLCDKVCQWLVTGWWFSPGSPVSSIDKTDCHDITEILLNVLLNTIKQTNKHKSLICDDSHLGFMINTKIKDLVDGHWSKILAKSTFKQFRWLRE